MGKSKFNLRPVKKTKYYEVHEDIQLLFDTFIKKIENLREVNIKILGSDRMKKIGLVKKADDILKHITQEDMIILINERVFEQLEDEQKEIVVEELLAEIYFDDEKSVVKKVKPDVNTFSLLLRKYDYKTKYERLQETIKAIFSQEAEVEAQNQ